DRSLRRRETFRNERQTMHDRRLFLLLFGKRWRQQRRRDLRRKFGDNVLPLLHQLRARTFNKVVRTERISRSDVSRYSKHFSILFHRQARSYQRSRILGRFHDHYSETQPANDAVSIRKVFRDRWRAQRELTDE